MQSIMVVEDDVAVAELLEDVLGHAGYRVHALHHLRSAWLALEVTGADLLIADVGLPDGSGIEVARRAEALGIPALLMTGHPGHMQELDAAHRIYLCKPFRLQHLKRQVRDLLQQRDEPVAVSSRIRRQMNQRLP